jgi:hydroxycarboxylate dehydrogenase B
MLLESQQLTRFVAAIFRANQSAPDEAEVVAHHLVDSNLAGHESHGVVRVVRYVKYVRDGEVRPNQSGTAVLDAGSTLLIDGNGGFGQVIGEEAARLGIERAKETGVALVGIRNVGHLGRIGGWAERATAAGVVSLHFVNSPGRGGIQVAPYGARERRLPPNPMAVGVPRPDGPPFILDFTASVVPEGKVLVALNAGELLPEGAAIDAAGRPTRRPEDYYGPPAGALLPIGGHKGSGLCMAIDLLAGALTRGGCSDPRAIKFGNNMLSIYIDPAALGSDDYLATSVADLSDWVKSAAPLVAGTEVLVPGEREARLRAERSRSGIPLDEATWRQIVATAAELGVADSASLPVR